MNKIIGGRHAFRFSLNVFPGIVLHFQVNAIYVYLLFYFFKEKGQLITRSLASSQPPSRHYFQEVKAFFLPLIRAVDIQVVKYRSWSNIFTCKVYGSDNPCDRDFALPGRPDIWRIFSLPPP